MAAFVVTFMGAPALGYNLNVDALKKLDVFRLQEANLLAYCDSSGHCYDESSYSTGSTGTTSTGSTTTTTTTQTQDTSNTGATSTGSTSSTSTSTSTSTGGTTDSGSTSNTGGTSTTTYTYTDASGNTVTETYDTTYTGDNGETYYYDYEDPTYHGDDYNEEDYQIYYENYDWSQLDYENTDFGQWDENTWQYMDWSTFDYELAGEDAFKNMDFEALDYHELDNNEEYWRSASQYVDPHKMEGIWSFDEYHDFYNYGDFDMTAWADEDWSQYNTVTDPRMAVHGDRSDWSWEDKKFGTDYWEGMGDWGNYDPAKGYFSDGDDKFYTTDWGFVMDDMGQFFDNSGKTYFQSEDFGKDFFKDESGNHYFVHDGETFDYEDGKGFRNEFGGKEFYSDYWFTRQYDREEDFGTWDDFNWEDMEYDWADWEGYNPTEWLQPMPPVEFEGEVLAFEGELENYGDPEFEWSFLQKENDYLADQLESTIELKELEVARNEQEGIDATALTDTVGSLTEVLENTQDFLAETEILSFLHVEDIDAVEAQLAALDENSTVGEVETVDMNLMKLDCYEALQGIMDSRNAHLDVLGEVTNLIEEIGVVKQIYVASAEGEIPSDLEEQLDTFEGEALDLVAFKDQMLEKYETAKALVDEIRASTDPVFVEQKLDEVWALAEGVEGVENDMTLEFEGFLADSPEEEINDYIEQAHFVAQTENMLAHVEIMQEEIGMAQDFIDSVAALDPEEPAVVNALNELDALADQGLETLNVMGGFLEEGNLVEAPEIGQELWETMDALRVTAELNMGIVSDWITENPEVVSILPEDTQDVVDEMLAQWENQTDMELDYGLMYQNYGFEEPEGWEDGDWEDEGEFDAARFEIAGAYTNLVDSIDFDGFVAELSPDSVEALTRFVPETVVEKAVLLAQDLGGSAEDTLTAALSNAEIIDVDFIKNTTDVYAVMDFDFEDAHEEWIREFPELQPEFKELEKYYEETLSTLIAPDSFEDAKEVWKDMGVLLETGLVSEDESIKEEAKVDLMDLIEVVEDVLAENEENLIEEKVAFTDVEPDEWFYGYVIGDLQEGDIKGYEDGSFKPEAEVTYAEALKIVSGAADFEVPAVSAGEVWYAEHVDVAREEGLSNIPLVSSTEWNEPCPRWQVATWIEEAFDLESEDALFDLGIFQGTAETGISNPDGSIIRAEITKVASVAEDTAGATHEVFDQMEHLSNEIMDVSGTSNEDTEDTEDTVSLESESAPSSLLEVLKNFFSSVLSL